MYQMPQKGARTGESAVLVADRSVSPVIGTVLLVGIVVVLAALAGAAVLTLGDEPEKQAPAFSFDTEFSAVDDVEPHWQFEVTHSGGESVPSGELLVRFVDDSGNQAEVAYPDRFSGGDRFRAGLWGDSSRANAGSCLAEPETDGRSDQLEGFGSAGEHATGVDLFVIHEPSNTVLSEESIDLGEEPDRFTGQQRHYLRDGVVPSVDCADVGESNW